MRNSSMDLDSESKLISLITEFMSRGETTDAWFTYFGSGVARHITEIISLLSSMDLDSLPKPQSELMSVTSQIICVFNSMDLDSQPKALSKVISRITDLVNPTDSDSDSYFDSDFEYNVDETLDLEPEPELLSLIYQLFSLICSKNSKWDKLISLCPQAEVRLEEKFEVEDRWRNHNKWACLPINWKIISFTGEDATHFLCRGCEGQNHKEHDNAPVAIKHPLHPKHSLQLVSLTKYGRTRECYCCDEDLIGFFYHCSVCDFAMKVACVEKPPVLSIDLPKWHEHTLALFSRTTSLTCDVCALTHPSCPFYICPPCGFVVHQKCINLPRVIRISRHPHRISFTLSFDQGDWSCGVCRRKIDNDYGRYSCIKDGCSYAAHSKCATQSNVWDGIELEGEPEEDIEEVEPFVRISDGIIQHFSHPHHHLRLDENRGRDYDEDKLCQACITPIYFGNFYSCMQCGFILHEKCAKFSRKMHHPIHPHVLTLVVGYGSVKHYCTACPWLSATGFFYRCEKEECDFQLHVQCATVFEPLVHSSHMHPLFLTSKPGEWRRICSVCKGFQHSSTEETFNCIEECDFALCYGCATLPHKLRYKHDKHILTLSYGEETSTMTYWCEACEGEIDPKKRFYMCDEYCCVTLHIDCMLGRDKYMEPGSSWLYKGNRGPSLFEGKMVCNLPNNHHMSRPSCSLCKRRCPYKIVFESSGSIYCSVVCIRY